MDELGSAFANWRCECGRHASIEHPFGGYCYARERIKHLDLALKYLVIEHRKEKEGPHHSADCDLCDFIAKARSLSV